MEASTSDRTPPMSGVLRQQPGSRQTAAEGRAYPWQGVSARPAQLPISPQASSGFLTMDVAQPDEWPQNETLDRNKLRRLSSAIREQSTGSRQQSLAETNAASAHPQFTPGRQQYRPSPGVQTMPADPRREGRPLGRQQEPDIPFMTAKPSERSATSLPARKAAGSVTPRQQAVDQLKAILQADPRMAQSHAATEGTQVNFATAHVELPLLQPL